MTKGIEGWFRTVPDQKWTSSNAWGIDGYAIVESTLTGTQKGRLGPIPPSTKPITAWHWLDISQPGVDGKVMHHWGFANLGEMLMQTGALKPSGAKMAGPAKAEGGKEPAAAPAPKAASPTPKP